MINNNGFYLIASTVTSLTIGAKMSNHLFLAYESCKDRFDKPITFDEFNAIFCRLGMYPC